MTTRTTPTSAPLSDIHAATTRPTERPMRILMVCTGNICRSQMAHLILADTAGRAGISLIVDSAGVSNEEEGNPIDRRAARVLREAGYPTGNHRARQIRMPEVGDWDLILAMTGRHRSRLMRLAEQAGVTVRREAPLGDLATTDIRMFRDFDPTATDADRDVPDPWYGTHADFLDTLDVIERVTPHLLDYVRARSLPAENVRA